MGDVHGPRVKVSQPWLQVGTVAAEPSCLARLWPNETYRMPMARTMRPSKRRTADSGSRGCKCAPMYPPPNPPTPRATPTDQSGLMDPEVWVARITKVTTPAIDCEKRRGQGGGGDGALLGVDLDREFGLFLEKWGDEAFHHHGPGEVVKQDGAAYTRRKRSQ